MKQSPLKRRTPLQSNSSLKRTQWQRKTSSKANKDYTKELREYIALRDGWCQICGGRGDQVHHVIPRGRYKAHPERYLLTSVHDKRNLMWICWKCHDHINVNRHGELERAIGIQERRYGSLRKESFVTCLPQRNT